jgi:hypothetical protein
VVEEDDIGGNTNGVFFFNTSSNNLVRHNIIAGNPPGQVLKTFVLANQQGADIAFRPNFSGANNTIEDNFCLTYIQGAGPATAPCPNIGMEGVEESASRLTSPLNGVKGSNGVRTSPSRSRSRLRLHRSWRWFLGWAFFTPVIRSEPGEFTDYLWSQNRGYGCRSGSVGRADHAED